MPALQLIETLQNRSKAAAVLHSFAVRYIDGYTDSMSGKTRPAYIIFDGDSRLLNGEHFSEPELQKLATELDEAFRKILRDRVALILQDIHAMSAPISK